MTNKTQIPSPVAVGGLGGSGTRVIAEILIRLGFYMGKELNRAYDNLWFAYLLKRPQWFMNNSRNEAQILKGLRIFEDAMTGCLDQQLDTLDFIVRAAIVPGYRRWPRAITIPLFNKVDHSKYVGWGWKEPNTHIFIEYLAKYFDRRVKYIHVIRHGLDMAYSGNQEQLHNWGSFFDVKIPTSPESLPKAALTYWIRANEQAIALGERYLGERFLVVNFDDLCTSPTREVEKLIEFIEFDASTISMNEISSIPKQPASIGRYKQHNLGIFNNIELDTVQKLGFDIDV
jgi:hypothetical protein